MNNTKVLEEFFVWEEKSLIDQSQNLLKNEEQDNSVITIETKTDSTPKDWRDITDPKLRRKIQKKISDSIRYKNKKNDIKLRQKSYREVNKDKKKAYYEKNKERINVRNRNRCNNNIQHKLVKRLRTRLCSALSINQKSGSAVRDLGCSIESFKSYLESKFQSGMSWDNYGLYGWHIDHIKPLSSFDLTDRKQLLEACHYTNLQPLWAKDNLAKSDKII
jgi:hypothetical protein